MTVNTQQLQILHFFEILHLKRNMILKIKILEEIDHFV